MATKDLYGIGKGSAQVVDMRPIHAMQQDKREATRKRNEAREKKRVGMATAINDSMNKLKNTAWNQDQKYIGGLMQETRKWLSDTYATHGEMAIVDDPAKKREFDERIAFIKQQNDASHANITMGNKMLERSSKNVNDIDEVSGDAFNSWLDLPPEERLATPMPIIKDREMTLDEVVERDVKSEIAGLQTPIGYTGTRDKETGRTVTVKGKGTDEAEYNDMIDQYNTSTNSSTFKYADRQARKLVNEDRYPPTITVDGEETENPEYQKQLNSQRRELIKESFDKQRLKDYQTSSASYGKATEDEDVDIIEDEAAVTTTEDVGSTKNYISNTYKDESGKKFFKLKSEMYEVGGKLYPKDKLPKSVDLDDPKTFYRVEIGSIIDEDQNIRPNEKGLTELKKKTTTPVIRKGSVSKPGKAKTFRVNKEYRDGQVSSTEDKSITGQMVGYEKVKLKSGKTEYIFQVKDKKGNIEDVPATDAVKETFSKEWKKIQETKKSDEDFIDIN